MSKKKYTVLCTLPNASEEINGVKFEKCIDGMIARNVPEDAAIRMSAIDGYSVKESEDPVDDESDSGEKTQADSTIEPASDSEDKGPVPLADEVDSGSTQVEADTSSEEAPEAAADEKQDSLLPETDASAPEAAAGEKNPATKKKASAKKAQADSK